MRDSRLLLQRTRAYDLHRRAKVPVDRPATFLDIPRFEQVIRRRIVVYSAGTGNCTPVYRGTPFPGKSPIFLYYTGTSNNGHFDAIISITGCICSSFYGESRPKPYDDKKKHWCDTFCRRCLTHNCTSLTPACREMSPTSIVCHTCNRTFLNQACFDTHLCSRVRCGKSTCETLCR